MKLTKALRIQLAKMIIKFGEINTDKGILSYEGDTLEIGMEVYIQDVDTGNLIPAPDDTYLESGGELGNINYIVVGGKITEIKSPEGEPIEETPVEEITDPSNLEETPAEETIEQNELKTIIEDLTNRIIKLEERVNSEMSKEDVENIINKLLSKFSLAKPAQEIVNDSVNKKTGKAKAEAIKKIAFSKK